MKNIRSYNSVMTEMQQVLTIFVETKILSNEIGSVKSKAKSHITATISLGDNNKIVGFRGKFYLWNH